jgi:CRISP-associated protein Cas1
MRSHSVAIARNLIAAKIANTRTLLQRAARDHGDKTPASAAELLRTADFLSLRLDLLRRAETLDTIRGIEGDAAVAYFAVFNRLITLPDPGPLRLNGRTRRPPLDPVNALLSFLYALLAHDCRSAAESTGLDPQCGFLHRDRPGRPSLALDLMEELRPVLADRAALTLINRQQIRASDFEDKGKRRRAAQGRFAEDRPATLAGTQTNRDRSPLSSGEDLPSACCRTCKPGSWRVISGTTWTRIPPSC